ncbi:uncharacterized protein LOC132639544 [Lycium barbarum]|uniref:uncharacterized protein LOC132639544 n=1 Tax=Lycium barbarum TaxID=112863 RepID=UPI00293E4404|nr:uncharacterized protein LOC132639544 [Lycium barbarum]
MAKLKVTKVIRKFPPLEWCVCNTDGASRGNPIKSTYGFCLRATEGDLIHAQTEDIGYATNTEAEVYAIHEALKFRKRNGWKPPWNIASWVDEVQDLSKDLDFIFTHTLREANKLADAFANHALDRGSLGIRYWRNYRIATTQPQT